LVSRLASVADEVYAIQECNTVFPGQVTDFFHKSEVMKDYFSRVIEAERNVFGPVRFSSGNVRSIALKMGDLNRMNTDVLDPVFGSDVIVVFGASYIKAPLIDRLIEKQALNIHMGISPYYRGSSCNFWAAYDGSPGLVGATIHLLSRGLDSGEMLYHALPKPASYDAFELGMRAVQVAHESLVDRIVSGEIREFIPEKQNKSLEKRYTRNADFDDRVASEYLARLFTPDQIRRALVSRDESLLLHPYYG